MREKGKIIIICSMWLSAGLSCLGDGLWVPLALALGAIYVTHHLLNFKI